MRPLAQRGFRMKTWMLSSPVALAAVLFFCWGTVAEAEPTNCPGFYAGAEAPTVLEPTLKPGLTEVCHHAYGFFHSTQTLTPLWSAEHLTTQSVTAAENQARVGSFHEETGLPSALRA